ncbi:hypothetical protein KFL_000060880 [Klebsormidium nitens]|uniref:Uncharacterized protein n=1 Tax=Klebsormidium nitens TaxID=105231 RepID=A0A0U9HI07_KLENI|nr:hypothetical protein KFL_000060880 [Klebsormidium nitens]|eukprot:GAQ78021.1 hypothetical protein KFL_000060880 [Klebsormidium nitens]
MVANRRAPGEALDGKENVKPAALEEQDVAAAFGELIAKPGARDLLLKLLQTTQVQPVAQEQRAANSGSSPLRARATEQKQGCLEKAGQKASPKRKYSKADVADAVENLRVKVGEVLQPESRTFGKIPKKLVYKLVDEFERAYPGMFSEDELYKKIKTRCQNQRDAAKRNEDEEAKAAYNEKAAKRMQETRAKKDSQSRSGKEQEASTGKEEDKKGSDSNANKEKVDSTEESESEMESISPSQWEREFQERERQAKLQMAIEKELKEDPEYSPSDASEAEEMLEPNGGHVPNVAAGKEQRFASASCTDNTKQHQNEQINREERAAHPKPVVETDSTNEQQQKMLDPNTDNVSGSAAQKGHDSSAAAVVDTDNDKKRRSEHDGNIKKSEGDKQPQAVPQYEHALKPTPSITDATPPKIQDHLNVPNSKGVDVAPLSDLQGGRLPKRVTKADTNSKIQEQQKVSSKGSDVITGKNAGTGKDNEPKEDATLAAGKRSERSNRGQTTRFEGFEKGKDRSGAGLKKRCADDDEEDGDDGDIGFKAGARVELLVKGKVIGTALVMLGNPTDTIRGKALGEGKLGVVVESVVQDARELTVPKGFTSFVAKSKKLKVGDLPVCQLIDWPEDCVEKIPTRKKARRG